MITLQIQNTESNEDYGCLCVNKADCAVDPDALEEAVTLAVQTSDEKTEGGRELIRRSAMGVLLRLPRHEAPDDGGRRTAPAVPRKAARGRTGKLCANLLFERTTVALHFCLLQSTF